MSDDHNPTTFSSVTELHRAQRDLNKVALVNQLRKAGEDGSTAAELVDQLGLSKTTVNRLLQNLTGQGLVERIHDRVRLIPDAEPHQEEAESPVNTPEGATLDTETSPQTTDENDLDMQPTGKPDWPWWATKALEQIRTTVTKARRFVGADPGGAATLAGTVVLTIVGVLVALSLGARLMGWLTAGDPANNLAGAVPASRIAIDPIEHWLTIHTAGLPLTVSAAAWTWAVVGLLLLAAAVFSHIGAQLLWVVYGTATAAMAWLGTPAATHRPIAAGLVAAAWAVLSLLVVPNPGRPRASRVIRVVRADEAAA